MPLLLAYVPGKVLLTAGVGVVGVDGVETERV